MKELKGKISGYSHEGAGVVRGEQQVCFVPGALKDEEIVFEVPGEAEAIQNGRLIGNRSAKSAKGKVAFGILTAVKSPSPYRVQPPCPLYGQCGGCQLQHSSYEHQLVIKHEIVQRAFRALGMAPGLAPEILPVLGAHQPWGYRNKGIFAVQLQEGKVQVGFYRKKSQTVAGIGCPGLFSKNLNGLLQAISFWLEGETVLIGNKGLHHIMVRESKTTGQITLVLIGNSSKPAWLDRFLAAFVPKSPQDLPPCAPAPKKLLTGIGWLRADMKAGPVISGSPETLWGSLILVEQLGKVNYGISAESFFQVNTAQAKVLYDQVAEFANLTGKERIWDLYCGIGGISLYLAKKANAVIGVESVGAAVKDGQTNARLNQCKNLRFVAGLAEEVLAQLLIEAQGQSLDQERGDGVAKAVLADKVAQKWQQMQDQAKAAQTAEKAAAMGHLPEILDGMAVKRSEKLPDVVVLDPPSKGCESAVLEVILKAAPQRIVYVSCDPATLVRDLKHLLTGGIYQIQKVQPVDLFPQTSHVECVVGLQKVEK